MPITLAANALGAGSSHMSCMTILVIVFDMDDRLVRCHCLVPPAALFLVAYCLTHSYLFERKLIVMISHDNINLRLF